MVAKLTQEIIKLRKKSQKKKGKTGKYEKREEEVGTSITFSEYFDRGADSIKASLQLHDASCQAGNYAFDHSRTFLDHILALLPTPRTLSHKSSFISRT